MTVMNVLAASRSFDWAFGLDPDHIKGRPLASLGGGEWAVPQLSSLLRATVAGSAEIEAYEFDLKRKGQAVRRLILNAQKLVYREQDHAKLLVAPVDVTEARSNEKLKDDLLREKNNPAAGIAAPGRQQLADHSFPLTRY